MGIFAPIDQKKQIEAPSRVASYEPGSPHVVVWRRVTLPIGDNQTPRIGVVLCHSPNGWYKQN